MEKRDKQHVPILTLKGQGGVTCWVYPFRAEEVLLSRQPCNSGAGRSFPALGLLSGCPSKAWALTIIQASVRWEGICLLPADSSRSSPQTPQQGGAPAWNSSRANQARLAWVYTVYGWASPAQSCTRPCRTRTYSNLLCIVS